MADVFTKAERSRCMSAIKSRGNKDTELKLMSIFREHRITGWRRGQKLPGKPDFVFRKQRVAVFVDGCFWHGCPQHGRMPESNVGYWAVKLTRNKQRDAAVTLQLRRLGWKVVRVWEHDLANTTRIAARIKKMIQTSSEILNHKKQLLK